MKYDVFASSFVDVPPRIVIQVMKTRSSECTATTALGSLRTAYGRREATPVDLPPTAHGLLHLGWGHGRWRTGHGDSGRRVDDWNSVAATCCRGLVKLDVHLLSLEAWRNESGRGRVE